MSEMELRSHSKSPAENSLAASFYSVLDFMPFIITAADKNGTLLFINSAAKNYFGIPSDPVKISSVKDIAKLDLAAFISDTQPTLNGTYLAGKIPSVLKQGTNFRILIIPEDTAKEAGNYLLVFEEEGNHSSILPGYSEFEKNNLGFRNLIRLIADNMPDLLWAKDLNKNFIFVNKAICETVLCTDNLNEPIGKNDEYFFSRQINSHPGNPEWHTFGVNCPDSDEIVHRTLRPHKFFESGKVRGKEIHLEIQKAPILDPEGNLLGTVGSARIVTEQKKIENELRENERKLDYIFRNMPALLVAVNGQGLFVEWNDECERVTGYTREEMILHPDPSSLLYPDKKYLAMLRETWNKLGGSYKDLEWDLHAKDGTVKRISWSNHSHEFPIEGWESWAIGIDVTERSTANQKLKESRDLFNLILTNIDESVLFLDPDSMTPTYWNDAFLAQFGYSEKQMTGFRAEDIFESETRYRNLLGTGAREILKLSPGKDVVLMRKSSGEIFTAELYRRMVKFPITGKENILITITDLSDVLMKDNLLFEKDQRLKAIFENAGNGILLCDLNYMILEVNPTFSHFTGLPLNEIAGRKFSDFFEPDTETGGGAPGSRTGLLKINNGRTLYLRVNESEVKNKNNESIYRVILAEDFTPEKLFEAESLRNRTLLKGIADSGKVLLTEKDFDQALLQCVSILGQAAHADRAYIFVNSTELLTGEHLLSQKVEWTKDSVTPQIDNPDLQNLRYSNGFDRWYEVMSRGENISGRVKDFPASEIPLLESQEIKAILVMPIITGGHFWGFIGFDNCTNESIYSENEISLLSASAISIAGSIERNLTNEELVAARQKAEIANNLKNNFLANMSHELRTPLIGMMGFSEILRDSLDDPRYKEMIDTIHQGSTRLSETLTLILELTQLESNNIEISSKIVDVKETVSKVADYHNPLAVQKGLFLNTYLPESPVLLKSDPKIISTVLNNLINNAIKYTNEGGISVSVHKETEGDKNFCRIKVSDTGIGISEDQLNYIFDEFRQGSEGFSRIYEGTGLGLSVTRKFIDKLGGKIDVESRLQKGSSFTISFEIPPILDYFGKPGEAKSESGQNRLPRILLVDDDKPTQTIIRLVLKNIGDVDVALNSETAVNLLSHNRYSLMLIDINLGKGSSGVELVHEIRKIPLYRQIPLVAFTAYAMAGDRNKLMLEGFTHYIAKPIEKKHFQELIIRLLGENKT